MELIYSRVNENCCDVIDVTNYHSRLGLESTRLQLENI